MPGGEATLALLAVCIAVGLGCVLRPPDFLLRSPGRLLEWLGVQVAPSGEERREAEQRARTLLRGLIGEDEFERVIRRGYLDVPSALVPGRTYRIPYARDMVSVIEAGLATMQLCVVPTRWVPDPDVVIMHKLLIEGDEARYLRIANRFPTATARLLAPSRWEGQPAARGEDERMAGD